MRIDHYDPGDAYQRRDPGEYTRVVTVDGYQRRSRAMMNIDNQDRECAYHRPVGTGGGCGDGKGPCAYPRSGHAMG
jgi:uncharacterized protein (DUF779 family)